MRPRFLEIEGLQSFRDIQKIDFDSLGETGLFGIFGPTGSGKSTVLDAVTFALYGKVKRAERGTQGIINTNLNIAKVYFTFELLKVGSRKTYRVERTYQRKKGSENSCEPKVARLIEVTEVGEIPVCDKATEVNDNIVELLGLSHDDFTRAVVLPQNSFQEFLLLNNSDKRSMLERIFYLEEYGKQLTDKLSRKMSMLKTRIDRLSGELSAYADASDEALEAAGKVLEAAILERDQVEKELKQLETRFNEAKEVWQLVQELELINQKEQQHLASKGTMDEKREQFDKAVKADGLLEMLRKVRELSEQLSETVKQLDEVYNELPGVAVYLNETRSKYEDLKEKSELEKPELVALKTRLSDALGLTTEITSLELKINELLATDARLKEDISTKDKAISNEKGELEAAENKMELLKSEMDALKIAPEYRNRIQEGVTLETEVKTLEKSVIEFKGKTKSLNESITGQELKLKGITDEITGLQQAVEALNVEKQKHEGVKPEDRNTVIKYKDEVHKLQTIYDVLKLKKSDMDNIYSKILKLKATLEQNTKKLSSEEGERLDAQTIYEQSRLEMERAVKAMEANTAYMLSKNLKEGDPCPVCGSEHHPHPAVQTEGTELAILEQQVESAEQRLKAAEKTLKAAESKCLITSEQIKTVEEQIRQTTEELDGKTADYKDANKNLPKELREMELDQLGSELDKMNNEGEVKLREIDTWEQNLEALKNNLLKLNEQLSVYRLEESSLLAGLKANLENKEQIEGSLKEASLSYDEKFEKYREFLDNCKIDSAAEELKRLAKNDREMNLLQTQMEETQALFSQKRAALERLKEENRVLTYESVKVEADRNNCINLKNEKDRKLKEIAGDADTEAEIARIDKKLEEYITLEKQYQEAIKNLEAQHNELITQKTTLENQKNIYTGSLEHEQEQLKTSIMDKGFADSDEVEKSILTKEIQKALREEINVYDQLERNNQAQKEITQKKLGTRSISEEEWDLVSNAYQEKAASKEACVSRYEVAKNTYSTIKDKHDRWMVLDKSYSELNHKQGLFEQIQKLLRAERGKDNSFIDFIAEERLRYVAAKASETLGLMTRYKYALELDINAGFIIRDNANGGVHRMVTSLSGGETFLTSLSLALALSEQIQLKGQSPLEFFFLDEGFGTLDNNLLDTVIDSLERLSKKERVIGLISHVPELRSRIARRLIVDPPSSQGDGSRVRIEKA